MKPHFQVVNNGTTSVDLTTLTVRYYYTKDGSPATDQAFNCDYALLGCSLIAATFNTTTGTNADEYAEFSFLSGAGMLAAGATTGEIQARIHPADYQYMFTQTNDYSFDATKLSYAYWSNITLYQAGTLVWGTEP
jgi:Cellulose binding domain